MFKFKTRLKLIFRTIFWCDHESFFWPLAVWSRWKLPKNVCIPSWLDSNFTNWPWLIILGSQKKHLKKKLDLLLIQELPNNHLGKKHFKDKLDLLLMEELLNNHLGCIKPMQIMGWTTYQVMQDFWTINSMYQCWPIFCFVCSSWESKVPPKKLPPPRNKALRAGLTKGNQWLIVPLFVVL